jgi:hypothetical protein
VDPELVEQVEEPRGEPEEGARRKAILSWARRQLAPTIPKLESVWVLALALVLDVAWV